MKAGVRINLIFASLMMLFSLNTSAQRAEDNDSVGIQIDSLYPYKVEMKMSLKVFKKKVFNYEEGQFIDYYFADSSIVTLFKGAMQSLPLLPKEDGYIIESTSSLNNIVSLKGIKEGRYWREDILPHGIRALYYNVPFEKKCIYDLILDSIFIEELLHPPGFAPPH